MPCNVKAKTKIVQSRKGFALISTIVIMSLLLMIALAMLSSSSVETRVSSTENYEQRAQANAKLALMIALGELQSSVGPDQRITAKASIFDKDPDNEKITGVAHQHYLAVLDSWDTYLNEKKYVRGQDGLPTTKTISIQETYNNSSKGRHEDLFRRYLVSHPKDSLLRDVNAALDADVLELDESNSVVLERNPYSDSDDSNDNVRVGLVEINSANGNVDGRYGWHVEGLNSKVSYQRLTTNSGDDSLGSKMNDFTVPRGFDLKSVEGLEDVDISQDSQKLISTSQLELLATNKAVESNKWTLNGYSQRSLLSDVRFSGMKKDINSFFETKWTDVDSKYKTARLAGVNILAPLRSVNGLDKLNQVEKNVPPTSWRQLRDYYMLYQQDTGNSNHLGLSQAHIDWDGKFPISDTFLCGQARRLYPWHHDYDHPGSLGYQRTPVIARWIYIVSLSSTNVGEANGVAQYELFVHYNPVIVLWNPYNTRLRMANRGQQFISGNKTLDSDFLIQTAFRRAFTPQYKVYKNDGDILKNWENFTSNNGQGQWADVMFKEANGKDVVFQPGEVKMFSYDSSASFAAGGHLVLTPGFNANVKNDNLQRVSVGRVTANDNPSLAMRFGLTKGHAPEAHPLTSTKYGGPVNAFAMDSTGQVYGDNYGSAQKTTRGHRGGKIIEWMSRVGVQIIHDNSAKRARWQSLGNTTPMPEAVVGIFLKSSEELKEEIQALESSKDVRNRNWLHSNPAHWWNHLFKPDEQKRVNFGYELHYNGNISGNAISEYVQSTRDHNAFIGKSMSADGVSYFPYQELPVTPITNLASFSGMKLSNGKTIDHPRPYADPANNSWGRNIQYASWGPAFGVGVGNSFAHPMIKGEDIYTGYKDHTNYSGQSIFGNYWDNLTMANDALWDSWFCSSMSAQQEPAYSSPKERSRVIKDFVHGNSPLPNYNLTLHDGGMSKDDLIVAFQDDDAFSKVASHLYVENGFNVNTASVDAWKALLHGLKGNQVPYIDAETGTSGVIPNEQDIIISRFGYATGSLEGKSDDDPEAWKGIRRLTSAQIDKLAEEMVKQVKLRGPFLNMSEFINRRLSDDKYGVTGALQAAIDWDDFYSEYSGRPAAAGDIAINSGFKSDSIAKPNATFPFPIAANGSRYTGIPGYVLQADILKLLGNSLTVRDDTFLIRAYGEALNEKGEVVARAWCEATVQRTPQYVEHDTDKNAPHQPAFSLDENNRPVASQTLSQANLKFGRKLQVISFRWVANPNKDNS